MEAKLFHALHSVSKPSLKEFREGFAFVAAVRKGLGKPTFDMVIDVAGGHGLVAFLFLLLERCVEEAVIVDPADVQAGRRGLSEAWGPFLATREEGREGCLRYRRECLRTGLPAELADAARRGKRVLVVACHACAHLSKETVEIATVHGADVAVMPCCQSDSAGGSWKALAKALHSGGGGGGGGGGGDGPSLATIVDLLLCGTIMARSDYRVRMKLIDPSITPQNRVIVARRQAESASVEAATRERAHAKLKRAYARAHREESVDNSMPSPRPQGDKPTSAAAAVTSDAPTTGSLASPTDTAAIGRRGRGGGGGGLLAAATSALACAAITVGIMRRRGGHFDSRRFFEAAALLSALSSGASLASMMVLPTTATYTSRSHWRRAI